MIGETAATAMRRLRPTSTMPASTTSRPRHGASGGMTDCTDVRLLIRARAAAGIIRPGVWRAPDRRC